MLLLLALLASLGQTPSWSPEPSVPGGAVREVRLVMGTTAEIRARGFPDAVAGLDAAYAALDRVDVHLSLWHPSELTALNETGAAAASDDLREVLFHALDVADASGGAFDPTVEPLLRAAGDYQPGPLRAVPARLRRRLRETVGWRHVHLETGGEVRLDRGTRLDFGGIAKGFAVDLAVGALRRAGAEAILVDFGGSSLAAFGEPLTVDVRDPEGPGRPPWARFHLQEGHLSSSGGDQRPGHILDPRTGLPAHTVLAAGVVAASGIEADALSTALYVLGPEKGLALVQRRGAEGYVLVRRASRRRLLTTPGFAKAHDLMAAPGVEVVP